MAFGMTAYNPVTDALANSAAHLRVEDEAERARKAGALVDFFDGNHKSYQYTYFESLIKDPQTLEAYKRHARQANITRLIVSRLAIGGETPIRVIWKDAKGDTKSDAAKDAADKWERIAHKDNKFDVFASTVYQRTALTKTVVAAATWDSYNRKIAFRFYTPNHVETRRVEQNPDPSRPDAYRILESEGLKGGTGEVWRYYDFSERGPVGWTWISGSRTAWNREQNEKVDALDTVDPESKLSSDGDVAGRALVPFVAFRTALPAHDFFVEDGQEDLYEAQIWVNQLWSQISVALYYMGSAIAVLNGPGWEGDGTKPLQLPMDPSVAIRLPRSPMDEKAEGGLTFLNPSNAENVKVMLETISAQTALAAAAQGISPDSISVSSTANSGVQLWIQGQEIRRWHRRFANMAQASWEEFVRVVRVTWDAQNQGDPFPADVTHTVEMGEYTPATQPSDELANDKTRHDMGIDTKEDLIRKYHPELDEDAVQARLAAMAPKPDVRDERPPVSRLFGSRPPVAGSDPQER